MIARVRVRSREEWERVHHNTTRYPLEKLSGMWIEIDLEGRGLGRPFMNVYCGGRQWLITRESQKIIEPAMGCFLSAGERWIVCEHAIEIGD
jgi:hypothetical protein